MGVPWPLVIAVGVPEVLGSLVGQSTRDDLLGWFATLRKPSWEPPGPLFGIAWTILYGFMGFASWRVWLQGGWQANQRALTLYVIQLALNLSWPLIFFKAKRLGTALAVNLVVLATAAATTSAFYKVDTFAGQLMLPYLAWLAFANALNLSILQKNPKATSIVEDSRSQGTSKRNPGEGGYSTSSPATAMHTAFTHSAGGIHARRNTVQVTCAHPSTMAKAAARPVPSGCKSVTVKVVRPQLGVRSAVGGVRASTGSASTGLRRVALF